MRRMAERTTTPGGNNEDDENGGVVSAIGPSQQLIASSSSHSVAEEEAPRRSGEFHTLSVSAAFEQIPETEVRLARFFSAAPSSDDVTEKEANKPELHDHNDEATSYDEESPPLILSCPRDHQIIETPNTDTGASIISTNPYTFEETCRLVMELGKAAMKYGATSDGVEHFLAGIMSSFGFIGVFRATQQEMFCSFARDDNDLGHTTIVVFQAGFNLNKLGLLAEMANRVKSHSMTPAEAARRLEAIDTEPDPWGIGALVWSFIAVGAGLAMLLEGNWWDVLVGAANGGIVFLTTYVFDTYIKAPEAKTWVNLVSSFICSTFATFLKALRPEINVTLVTMSGVAILLPGYNISLGTAELVSNHIISGSARILNGMVVMLWLVLGAWLGKSVASSIVDIDVVETSDHIPLAWQGLFVPLLFLSITIAFQVSMRDVPWALLSLAITYLTTLGASLVVEKNLGTFLSALAMTLFANLWSMYTDRPNTLVLLPSFVLKVSGSIGFLGLVGLVEGERYVGTQQFLEMFLVALLIVAGLFAGNTLFPKRNTL